MAAGRKLGWLRPEHRDPHPFGATCHWTARRPGQVTGTRDKDYNLLWFTEQCLSNALRLEEYLHDAERDRDSELADFFRRAQAESRKGGEQGKAQLRKRHAA